jgi:ribosomal protein L37AE/L43A
MEEIEKSQPGKTIKCPLCGNPEIHRIGESGPGYQCQKCFHQFRSPGEQPNKERDYDFPSPEDHELQ